MSLPEDGGHQPRPNVVEADETTRRFIIAGIPVVVTGGKTIFNITVAPTHTGESSHAQALAVEILAALEVPEHQRRPHQLGKNYFMRIFSRDDAAPHDERAPGSEQPKLSHSDNIDNTLKQMEHDLSREILVKAAQKAAHAR